jgi:hypothetical protein
MKIVGMLLLLVVALSVPEVYAQEAVKPNIRLTLTETLDRIGPGLSTRDDLREIPPPRNDKLSDTVRVTVSLGSPECLPGEDGWIAPRAARRPARSR